MNLTTKELKTLKVGLQDEMTPATLTAEAGIAVIDEVLRLRIALHNLLSAAAHVTVSGTEQDMSVFETARNDAYGVKQEHEA